MWVIVGVDFSEMDLIWVFYLVGNDVVVVVNIYFDILKFNFVLKFKILCWFVRVVSFSM